MASTRAAGVFGDSLRLWSSSNGGDAMNLWTGNAMWTIALILILLGCPDRNGVHRRFLQFSSAQVLYPPIILAFAAMGTAAVIGSIWK
jgi:hypothetical protein